MADPAPWPPVGWDSPALGAGRASPTPAPAGAIIVHAAAPTFSSGSSSRPLLPRLVPAPPPPPTTWAAERSPPAAAAAPAAASAAPPAAPPAASSSEDEDQDEDDEDGGSEEEQHPTQSHQALVKLLGPTISARLFPGEFHGKTKYELAKFHLRLYWATFGVADLKEMNSMGALAAWHTFGAWLAACTLMCASMQRLLGNYVHWLLTEGNAAGFFFVTMLQAWFLVCFFSDLIRFCSWFGRDAWRADAFEAYRRALLGLGDTEMKLGRLYSAEWPERAAKGWRRVVDVLVQVAIYVSLDVLPLLFGAQAFATSHRRSGAKAMFVVVKTLTISSLVHVTAFWLAWLATDLRLKYEGFLTAKMGHFSTAGSLMGALMNDLSLHRQDSAMDNDLDLLTSASNSPHGNAAEPRDFGMDHAAPSRPGSPESAGAAPRKPSDAAPAGALVSDRDAVRKRTAMLAGDWSDPEMAKEEAKAGIPTSVADRMNICVPLCRVLNFVVSHALIIAVAIYGIWTGNWLMILLAIFLLVYDVSTSVVGLTGVTHWVHHGQSCPRCWYRRAKKEHLWNLQHWGEVCLGLDPQEQLQRRMTFAVMIALHAVLFSTMGWWRYTAMCVVLLVLQAKQLTVRGEMPWGWFVGLLEAGIMLLLTVVLSCTFHGTAGRRFTIFACLAHQCGLARKDYYGESGGRVVRLVVGISFVVLLVTLFLALQAQEEAGIPASYTKLCRQGNCSFYTVPYKPPEFATSMSCSSWFSLGSHNRTFSLTDFGLFASTAYESNKTMSEVLELWFPGWQITHVHRAIKAHGDWTSFYDFTDPDNTTTVFAVRGTQSKIDMLNDIVLWMPVVIMQGFDMVGPDFLASAIRAIEMVAWDYLLRDTDQQVFIDGLMDHVLHTMRRNPERQYFIAGHSLGGGLAKFVSVRVSLAGLSLPAITFMSPGLEATAQMILRQFGNYSTHWVPMHKATMLTMQPDNDIVSRVDSQRGLVLPVECDGDPLTCHLLFSGALCKMFEDCGSGRPPGSPPVRLPCDACECSPCPGKERPEHCRAEDAWAETLVEGR